MDSPIQNKKIKLEHNGHDEFNQIRVHCLYIIPIKPDMEDKIKEYFSSFGEINSMEILQKQNVQHGLIEFKAAKTAEVVLATKNHCIEGCNVDVKVAEPWHQPDHILNALDEYCLGEVFSNLNVVDLENAANVCVRFNQQAKVSFSAKYKRLDLTKCSMVDAKNAIQTFGSLAHSIDIGDLFPTITIVSGCVYETVKNHSEILSMIDSCCTSTLTELKLVEFDFGFEDTLHDEVIPDSAFNTLEKLSFYDCSLTSCAKSLLALCKELKALKFSNCSWIDEDICLSKYQKLEELQLIKRTKFNDRTFRTFINLNPTLLKLSFVGLGRHDISVIKTLHSIAEKLPDLLELEFRACTYSVNLAKSLPHLAKLTSLKVLKIDLATITAKQLGDVITANGIPIEHLRLNFGEINEDAIESISQMKSLKILELSDTDLTDNNLMELAKDLGQQLEKLGLLNSTAKNLTTIELKKMLPFAAKLSHFSVNSETITIDLDDYKTMLDVIKKREEERSLIFELIGREGRVHIPKATRLENCHIFNIKEVDNNSDEDDDDYDSSSSDSDPYGYESDDYYSFGSD